MSRTIALTAYVVLCWLFPVNARAQYEVAQDSELWFRALVDVRLVSGGPAPSWTDEGPGKMRYGGRYTASGYERATRLVLSRLAIEPGASLPWGLRVEAQLNVQHDVADSYRPWLTEAIVRKEWAGKGQGGGVQVGVTNLPFSLEHTWPAWSPKYTISASALNAWLWEDISLTGMEAEWWKVTSSGVRFGVLGGAGFGADQVGRVLALRGWVLGDTYAGVNGSLPLSARTGRQDIFVEDDHRPAFYGYMTVRDPQQIVSLKLGMFDNGGNQDVAGVWHTHFNMAGLTLHPYSRIDVLVQYLEGVGRVRSPPNDSKLSAFYVLLSGHYGRERASIRYDSFRVHSLENVTPSTSEQGHAVTASFIAERGLHHSVAFEHIWLRSRRTASNIVDPTPDGWQLSYRFRY